MRILLKAFFTIVYFVLIICYTPWLMAQKAIKSVEEFTTEYDKNKPIKKDKEERYYDKAGNLIKQVMYDKGLKVNRIIEYKYAHNRLEQQIEYDGAKQIREKTTYEYNQQNQKTTVIKTDAKGQIKKKIIYTYDSNGQKISKTEYNAKGEIVSKTTYQYSYYE